MTARAPWRRSAGARPRCTRRSDAHSARASSERDWSSVVPIVTSSPTPAAAARSRKGARSPSSESRWQCESISKALCRPDDVAREDALRRRQRDAARQRLGKGGKLARARRDAELVEHPAMLPGMNGCSTVAIGRSTSTSTRSTAAMRAGSVCAAPRAPGGRCRRWRRGSPARPRPAPRHRLGAAAWGASRPARRMRLGQQSRVSSSVSGPRSGSTPPRFLATSDRERCARLPRSLASSLFMRLISARRLKSPSLPNGISRSRK